MVKLYKDGNVFGVETDAISENDFVHDFCKKLSSLIDKGEFEDDWEFQLTGWLAKFPEVCNHYRGHDSKTKSSVLIRSGGAFKERHLV